MRGSIPEKPSDQRESLQRGQKQAHTTGFVGYYDSVSHVNIQELSSSDVHVFKFCRAEPVERQSILDPSRKQLELVDDWSHTGSIQVGCNSSRMVTGQPEACKVEPMDDQSRQLSNA